MTILLENRIRQKNEIQVKKLKGKKERRKRKEIKRKRR